MDETTISQQIEWLKLREVYADADGDEYVRLGDGSYMELTDYVNGGQVLTAAYVEQCIGVVFVGRFSNAELANR